MKKKYLAGLKMAGVAFCAAAILTLGAKPEKGQTADTDAADSERLAKPLAIVNGKPITLNYVETITRRQNPMMRKDLSEPKKRREFIDKVVEMELLAQEAEKRGFNNDSEVDEAIKNRLSSLMHKYIAESLVEHEPTEEELKAYYKQEYETYHKPEMVRASRILFKDKEKAEKLLAELLSKKVDQSEFRKIAQEKSEDQNTKTRGGDLGFFAKVSEREKDDPIIDSALIEAAFKIKKNGDIYSKTIETKDGFSILMRTGDREKMDLSFEQSRDRLTVMLAREKMMKQMEDKIDEIKKRFNVEVFEENLKYVVIDLSTDPTETNSDRPRWVSSKSQ